jgi:serine/threonine protein kinase
MTMQDSALDPSLSESDGTLDLIDYARNQISGVRKASPLWNLTFHAPDSVPGYDLVELIHRGGQGAVYRAVQRSTRKSAAVKLFPPAPSKDCIDRERFQREIDALSRLDDPHIVSIRDSGSVGPIRYVVMDYVAGASLEDYVQNKKLPLREILLLLAKISKAVHFAHQRGIIHRDLKPGNILVTPNGDPRILDFGLARVIQDESHGTAPLSPVTITGQFVGSLPWASPEQARGDSRTVDVRTDIYSLGVILYQLLTGKFPYNVAGTMRAVLHAIQNVEPTKPRSLRREVDDDVETILLTCLQKDPARRYQSAAELTSDLDRYLSGRPIQAKRDSTWYVLRRTIGRHRVLFAGTSVVLVLMIAYAITTTTLLGRARTAERKNAGLANEVRMDFRLVQQTVQNLLAAWGARFGRESGAQPAQRAMLQQAYSELLPLVDRPPREPDDAVDLAVTYFILGDICQKLGNNEEAVKHLDIAADLRRRRATESPDDLDNLAKLSVNIVRIGDCGEGTERFNHFMEALHIDEDLYARDPQNLNYRSNLAWSYERIAALEPELVDSTIDKYEYFRKAMMLFEEITKTGIASDAAPASEHHGLCTVKWRLSMAKERSGDFETAQSLNKEAISACRRAVELKPNDPIYLRDVAGTLVTCSYWSLMFGDAVERWRLLDEAEVLYSRLSQDDPTNTEYLIGLANIAQYRSEEASAIGDWTRERSLHEYAFDLCNKVNALAPNRPDGVNFRFRFLGHFARRLFNHGDTDAARSMMLEAIALAEKQAQESTDHSIFVAFSDLMLNAVPPELRDTSKAVALAQRAVELTDQLYPLPLSQLATALYADGQTKRAFQIQRQALSTVPPNSLRAKQITSLFSDAPVP